MSNSIEAKKSANSRNSLRKGYLNILGQFVGFPMSGLRCSVISENLRKGITKQRFCIHKKLLTLG